MKHFLFLLLIFPLMGFCWLQPFRYECRMETVSEISSMTGFRAHSWQTSSFNLQGYIKGVPSAEHPYLPIYIEGDGAARRGRYTISPNPTPTDPIALRLAGGDPMPAVIYLGRPCQYLPNQADPACHRDYWASKRFASKVIQSYHDTLDHIKQRWGVEKFILNGFSGGGGVAVLVAADRDDVIGLRTVAGNLDHDAINRYHDVALMPQSLNPIDVANEIADIPQRHYSGGKDLIVRPWVAEQFIKAMEPKGQACATSQTLPMVEHEKGWDALWPQLVQQPLICWGKSADKSTAKNVGKKPEQQAGNPTILRRP